jgi:hypothetical protein
VGCFSLTPDASLEANPDANGSADGTSNLLNPAANPDGNGSVDATSDLPNPGDDSGSDSSPEVLPLLPPAEGGEGGPDRWPPDQQPPADARPERDVIADVLDDRDASDGQPDEGTDAPAKCSDKVDFYVDPQGPDDGCWYPTITAAVAAANASSAPNRTVHVAPGTYSTAEKFPIVLRGVSLVGSGVTTVITGEAIAAAATLEPLPWGAFPNSATAAIVTGDAAMATRIEHVSIQASTAQAEAQGSVGVLCDRGTTAGVQTHAGTPNTILHDVTLSGFETGVRIAASSGPPSGCAMLITSCTIQNGSYGVYAEGSSLADGTPVQRVSVQLGDGTPAGANVLRQINGKGSFVYNGAGLMLRNAVTGVAVLNNTFTDSDQGICALQGSGADTLGGFDIEQNDISRMGTGGIGISGPVVVDRLLSNNIHDMMAAACGLALQTYVDNGIPSTAFPTVRRARGNTFFGNGMGIVIRDYEGLTVGPYVPLQSTIDFGSSADPGNNVLRCNSSLPGQGDVVVNVPGGPSRQLPFESNVWDHAPPSGDDVLPAPGSPQLDTAKASAATSPPCPPGRGP